MGSCLVEVDHVRFEHPLELLLVEDEEMVQTFLPDCVGYIGYPFQKVHADDALRPFSALSLQQADGHRTPHCTASCPVFRTDIRCSQYTHRWTFPTTKTSFRARDYRAILRGRFQQWNEVTGGKQVAEPHRPSHFSLPFQAFSTSNSSVSFVFTNKLTIPQLAFPAFFLV